MIDLERFSTSTILVRVYLLYTTFCVVHGESKDKNLRLFWGLALMSLEETLPESLRRNSIFVDNRSEYVMR